MNELKKHFGKYDIVYLDPPWKYFGSKTKDCAAGKHYVMLSDDEIYTCQAENCLDLKMVRVSFGQQDRS